MLLKKLFLNSAACSNFNVSLNPVCIQSVRWRRKGRWMPTAPSKVFRVPVRPVVPKEEYEELSRINKIYKTQMRSLRKFIIDDVKEKSRIQKLTATKADEEADFQRSLAINETWNNEIAKIREARLAEERMKREEKILEVIERKKLKEEKVRQKIEAKILKEIEASKSYITRDNIDQAIEHALANPVSFNFAIDLNGSIYHSGKLFTNDEGAQEPQS